MGIEIVKRVSIDPIRHFISITSTRSDFVPRDYDTWHPLERGDYTFDEWLADFARGYFDEFVEFLPSCESKAHEAYLRTCERMGGTRQYAFDSFDDIDGPEFETFR